MKHILVIGSSGFIGRHCLSYFRAKEDITCWGCDVSVNYTDPLYHQTDPTDGNYQSLFGKADFDVCINCSGAASVPDSYQNPVRDFTLNTFNVYRILGAIKTLQPDCRFINLSSAAVYGNPQQLPVREASALNPVSPYGWNKRHAEEICQNFNRYFGVNTCSLRIFSAFGEGLQKQLFWDVAMKAKSHEVVELFGTGEEMRDFIYIWDLIRAIELVANSAPFNGECINIASGIGTPIREAVALLLTHLGYQYKVRFTAEQRQGDPSKWIADIGMLNSFGFSPKYSLSDGLKKYAWWLKENGSV